jgi:hypothetical protein
LLLAYASNFITPEAFWPIAFFGLAYPYLLLINLFFLGFWTWRKNKRAVLSFLIIIVGVGNIGRYVQLRPSQANYEKDSTQLRLVSYNVRVFNTYKWSGEEIGRDSILEFVNSKTTRYCLPAGIYDT